MVTHYVSSEIRSSRTDALTRIVLLVVIAAVGYWLATSQFDQKTSEAWLTALTLAVISVALSLAFPIILNMFRWMLGLAAFFVAFYFGFEFLTR